MISLSKFLKIYFSLLISAAKVIISLFTTIFLLGIIISIVEKVDFWYAQYLSLAAALTVGYCDFTPQTPFGRVISIILAIIGMVFMGIMTAAAIKSLEKASQGRG